MRSRFALLAALVTVAAAFTVGPRAWAQQETRPAAGRPGENQNADRDRNQPAGTETIHGIVAGITAEGEATFDYRANRATMANAAFLTVVGTPAKWDEARTENRRANNGERAGSMGKRRHNVYMVWLTPRTKVCEASAEQGRPNSALEQVRRRTQASQGQNQASQGEKKECTLDQLEVGDHVVISFNPREESGASSVAHQTEQMRQKHGRHRTYVGYATEITIVTPRDEDRSDSAAGRKPGEGSR